MPVTLHWHTEPLLVLTMVLAGWAYALCVLPLRQRLAPLGTPFSGVRAALFFLGIIIAYLTVGSPLDQLGEDFLFSAHMVQHMLLIYVVPPLIIRGVPPWLWDRMLRPRPVRGVVGFLVHPVFAGLFFTFLYTVWHIPVLYELALREKFWHVVEHWTMFGPALLMWWPLISESRLLPAISHGARLLYIFLLMVAQLPVFAFLTLSGEVLYPTYAYAPRLFPELPPLNDQVLGGIIMKVVNMVVSLSLLAGTFYLWYLKDQRETA